MRTNRVLIGGAGPIDAVLAYASRRRDIPVVLIEALSTPEIDCRAAARHPPAVAMIDVACRIGTHSSDANIDGYRRRATPVRRRRRCRPCYCKGVLGRDRPETAGCTDQKLFGSRDAHLTRS